MSVRWSVVPFQFNSILYSIDLLRVVYVCSNFNGGMTFDAWKKIDFFYNNPNTFSFDIQQCLNPSTHWRLHTSKNNNDNISKLTKRPSENQCFKTKHLELHFIQCFDTCVLWIEQQHLQHFYFVRSYLRAYRYIRCLNFISTNWVNPNFMHKKRTMTKSTCFKRMHWKCRHSNGCKNWNRKIQKKKLRPNYSRNDSMRNQNCKSSNEFLLFHSTSQIEFYEKFPVMVNELQVSVHNV